MLRDKPESALLYSAHPCPIATTFLFMSPVVSLLLGKTVKKKRNLPIATQSIKVIGGL